MSPLRRYRETPRGHLMIASASGVIAAVATKVLGGTLAGSIVIGVLVTWALLISFLYIDRE